MPTYTAELLQQRYKSRYHKKQMHVGDVYPNRKKWNRSDTICHQQDKTYERICIIEDFPRPSNPSHV